MQNAVEGRGGHDRGAGGSDRYPFSFTGSGGEYFRIWIVNVLLSIVTLYIYSAWAKVRTRRYFHGNTVLDGSAFEYHARPLQILLGRVIAVVLFVLVTFSGIVHPLAPIVAAVVLLLVLPWAVWRSTMFNARMTSYRNVRFGFDGGLGKMYLYVLVLPFLPLLLALPIAAALGATESAGSGVIGGVIALGILAFYALSPWVHRKLAGYFADNYRYGRAPFAATLSTGRFYAIYIQAFLLSILVVVILGAVVAAIAWSAGLFDAERLQTLAEADEETMESTIGLATLALYPLFFLTGYFVSAFFRARIRNHLYGNTVVDDRVRLESTVTTWPLWRLLIGNLLLLVFTLGIAYPWTKVRVARFFADRTAAFAPDGLHAVVDDEHERQSALGEELGDAFDMDMDVGF